MDRIINIISNENVKSKSVADKLKTKLISLGFIVPETFSPSAELIICIGGDGSFLNTIHKYDFPEIPIVGINTGHLGFFQEICPYEIDHFLELYMSDNFYIQKINPLEASICTKTNCIDTFGINEIVIRGDMSRTIHMSISVNDTLIQNFSGDGIIVSTPTGSTAYNYSTGGSIVDPSLKLIQITPLSPINTNAYRSFTSSIILPDDAVVRIYPEYRFENSILLVSDGVQHKHDEIVKIELRTSDMEINLIRFNDYDFWTKATEKFL